MITAIIIDVILAVLILVCCIRGYRRGFVRSLLGLAGFLIAVVAASLFSGALAARINDDYAEETIKDVIYDHISSVFEENEDTGEKLFSVIDHYVFGNTQKTENYVETISEGGRSAIEHVSSELANSISVPLCNSLAFFAVFLVALFVVKIVTAILDRVFSLPVLKTANRVLGLLFGVACGILYAMLFSRIFVCILPWLSGKYMSVFPTDLVEKAHLLNFFSQFNLFKEIVTGIADVIK